MNLKKTIVSLMLLFTIFVLSACDPDPFAGKRPLDYEDSIWICEHPYIVYAPYDQEQSVIKKNGESINITFMWSKLSSDVIVYEQSDAKTFEEKPEDQLFMGSCTFGSEKFTIYVTDENECFSVPISLEFGRVQ